ncbi:MAG: hypothetical protein OEZ39_20305 [Gammaproteobacteria bacterium]|nr:hypothetical protein [Gammaproteobacteria bacterium]
MQFTKEEIELLLELIDKGAYGIHAAPNAISIRKKLIDFLNERKLVDLGGTKK